MSSGMSATGLILVLLFIFICLGLLLQVFYVLWYRRRFRQRSAGDSELASVISGACSGTPVSKELALYYLYYRNQLPSATPNSEAASTSPSMWASAPTVDAAGEAMHEAPAMSMPPEEAAAAASEDEEEKRDEYEQDPEAMVCPSFSVMVRDFSDEDEDDRESASAHREPGGGERATSRKGHGRLDATAPSTSPPLGSPLSSPEREVVELRRYAGQAARRVAVPS